MITCQAPTIERPQLAVRAREPKSIPGYQLLRELGRGGMGVVYQGRSEKTGMLVAVKCFISCLGLEEADAQRRFQREIGAISRLTHPNIVCVRDSAQYEGVQFLVMEYLDGIDLNRLLVREGELPINLVCEYMRQAALGLQHAHDQGIVHRDIKPANLMVTPIPDVIDGPPGTVKVLDLGLARLLEGEHGLSLSSLTHDGMIIGTPDYIAPEQVENSHEVDTRADIYSLGCTFYELLTGQVPFPNLSVMDKLDRHRWTRPRQPELIRREIPRALGNVVRTMLAKDPNDRFQSFRDFLAALEQWPQLASKPAKVPLPSPQGKSSEERLDLMRLALAEMLDRKAYVEASELVGAMLQRNGNDSLALAVRAYIADHEEPVGEVACLQAHSESISSATFLPDGKTFLVGGGRGFLSQWDAKACIQLRSLAGHIDSVRSIAVNPDGTLAVTAGKDGRIILWDLATGRLLRTCRGRSRFCVHGVAFAPDGQRFASASSDGCVRLWSVGGGERLWRFSEHASEVKSVVFAADGQTLISGSWDHTVRVWNIESRQEVRRFDGLANLFDAVAVTPDGRRVLGAGSDPDVYIWNVESGAEVGRLEGHGMWVTCVTVSPDGRYALSGSRDHTVRLWDLDSHLELSCFNAHATGVTCVAFAPDGRHALSGSVDGQVRYWHLPWA